MQRLKKNFYKTIPVLTGYIVLGIAFGIMLAKHGYNFIWAIGMTTFIYAGSMQFIAINLMTSNASLILVAFTTFLVNARHLFYGISMIEKYRNAGKYKPYLIFGLTDETYSLVSQDNSLEIKDYFQITLLNQIYCIVGSIIGSVLGAIIPFDFKGVDFVLTALFVSIVVEQWLTSSYQFLGISSMVIAIVSLIIFGPNIFLIIAMGLVTLLLLFFRYWRSNKDE